MVVKLDLRVNKQEAQQDTEEAGCHYTLFSMVALFSLTSLLLFGLCGYKLYSAMGQSAEIAQTIQMNGDRMTMLDIEFQRLNKQSSLAEAKLDFLLADIPSVEFLSDVNEKLIDGIIIESLSMNGTSAALKGAAFSDEEVVQFSDALLTAATVDSVSLPVITSDKRNGIGIRAFSIEVKLKPIQKAIEAGVFTAKKPGGAPKAKQDKSSGAAPAETAHPASADAAGEVKE